MQKELLFFGRTFLAGVCLAACYDILRIFRNVVMHSPLFIGIEDILFGCAAGLFLFSVIYMGNDGIIRIYALCAVIAGIFLYHEGPGTILVKYVTILLKQTGKWLRIFGKPLRKWRKRLKNYRDRVKIFLYKQKSISKNGKRENEEKRKKKPAK